MKWNGMIFFCIAMAPRAAVIYPKERASSYVPLSFDLFFGRWWLFKARFSMEEEMKEGREGLIEACLCELYCTVLYYKLLKLKHNGLR